MNRRRASLTGEIADQAQLRGLIAHVGDLGLAIRSFGPVGRDPDPAGAPDA